MEAFLIEAELLLDWYLPAVGAAASTPDARTLPRAVARRAAPAIEAPPTWVLRDYHSPNLLWLPDREGLAQIGVLDFQDALIGPAAYDVASLLQDARVDVAGTLEVALLGRYVRARRAQDGQFDAAVFAQLYATLAAQRATKILGIFCPARPARRQAAISASPAPPIGLSAAVAGASGAGAAARLVRANVPVKARHGV